MTAVTSGMPRKAVTRRRPVVECMFSKGQRDVETARAFCGRRGSAGEREGRRAALPRKRPTTTITRRRVTKSRTARSVVNHVYQDVCKPTSRLAQELASVRFGSGRILSLPFRDLCYRIRTRTSTKPPNSFRGKKTLSLSLIVVPSFRCPWSLVYRRLFLFLKGPILGRDLLPHRPFN